MINIFKFTIYFAINFAILCIPIKEATIFDHLHDLTSPYTDSLFQYVKHTVYRGFNKSLNLLSNTLPSNEDRIKNSASAPSRKDHTFYQETQIPNDEYTAEEKAMLEKILQDYNKKGH